MSTERDLLTGIAQTLAGAGVALFKPGSFYDATDTAIVFGELQETPDRQVALTCYSPNDLVTQNVTTRLVQFMLRGKPGDTLDADDLADDIFNVLQDLTAQQWGSVWLVQASRSVNSSAIHGLDASLRSERADNYLFRLGTPATPRRF